MGDPRKIRKKYAGPRHPWEGDRIEKERSLIRNYGLKNKKEIWKMDSRLKKFKDQVKGFSSRTGEQAEKEKAQLKDRLVSLGIINKDTPLDSVLGLGVESIMDRRLQSIVYNQGLAKTMKQARQFIIHEHITLDGKKVTTPSHMVRAGQQVAFSEGSDLADEMHPERVEKKPTSDKVEKKGESTEEKIKEAKEKPPKAEKESDDKEEQTDADSEAAGDDSEEKASEEKEESTEEDSSADEGSSEEKKDVEEEIPETESSIRNMTKDDMQEYAEKEYGIELDTNNLKDEMVENFINELEEKNE